MDFSPTLSATDTELFRNALVAQARRGEAPSRWYCDRADCGGEPHEGWHWCKHAICPRHGTGRASVKPGVCPACDAHTAECRHARAAQRPPPDFVSHEARIWMLMAGRGYGKSRAGAEWLVHEAVRSPPGTEWAVAARTSADLRATCFEGKSGLLKALGWRRDDPRYNKTALLLRLPGEVVINSYSAAEPSSVHGPNLAGVWLDEIAKWKGREMWDSISFAIRDGDAQTVATTTPARVPLVREFVGRTDGSVVITRGTTFDNEHNLSRAFIAEQKVRHEGTRLGRQELYGELLEDVPGALWTADMIERARAVLV